MKREAIEAKFTEVVNGYLAAGYKFHTTTMAGHQGEIAKVDLYKGEEMVRVELSSNNNWELGYDMVILEVGKWQLPASTRTDVAWGNQFEILDKKEYYQIQKHYGYEEAKTWYTESMEEAKACSKKHWDRYIRDNNRKDITSDTSKAIAAKYLKRKGITKKVSRNDIKVEKYNYNKQINYEISYRGNTYTLVVRRAA